MTVEGFDIFKEGVSNDQFFRPNDLVKYHDVPVEDQDKVVVYREEHGDEVYAQHLGENTEVRARRKNEDILLLQLMQDKGQPPPTPTPLPPTPTPPRLPTDQRPVSSPDSVLAPPGSPLDSPGPDNGPPTAHTANQADKRPDDQEPASGNAPVHGAVASKTKKNRRPTSGPRKIDSQKCNQANVSFLSLMEPLSPHAELFRLERHTRPPTHSSQETKTGSHLVSQSTVNSL